MVKSLGDWSDNHSIRVSMITHGRGVLLGLTVLNGQGNHVRLCRFIELSSSICQDTYLETRNGR